jgi:hypothetical protein
VLFDWHTCATLIVVFLFDGMRRVPAGGMVLRRLPGGDWQVAFGPVEEARLQFVSIFPPLTMHCVIMPVPNEQSARAPERLSVAWVVALRLLGAFPFIATIVVLPWLLAIWGDLGFVVALITMLLTSIVTATAAACGFRSLQLEWRRALRAAAPLLWPFSAPKAAERLVERAMLGTDPVKAVQSLLRAHAFAAWVRPLAYDAVKAGTSLDDVLSVEDVRALVAERPPGLLQGERFCSRCGASFVARIKVCIDCGVPTKELSRPVRRRSRRTRKIRMRGVLSTESNLKEPLQ